MGAPAAEDDAAWIEAELERQLLEVEIDGDDDDDEGSDRERSFAAARDAGEPLFSHSWQSAEGSPGDEATVALPGAFQELVQCMQEWQAAVVDESDEAARSAQLLSEDIRKELAEKAPPALAPERWQGDGGAPLDEEERAMLEEVVTDVAGLQNADELRKDIQAIATSRQEWEKASPKPVSEKDAQSEEQNFTPAVQAIPTKKSEVIAEPVPQTPAAVGVAVIARVAGNVEDDAWQVDEDLAEQQRKIEAERLDRLANLEKEQRAALARLRAEEEAQEAERARSREEMAMHSEEIHMREFLSSLRRERLSMAAEDRLSIRVRKEEIKIQADAARRQEAAEGCRMCREDAASLHFRWIDWELRESKSMAAEDAWCHRWREELRLRYEFGRMAREDEASRVREELVRVSAEVQRMTMEDDRSAAVRQCDMTPATRSGQFRRGFAPAGTGPLSQQRGSDPAEDLACLVLPPGTGTPATSSSAPPPTKGHSPGPAQNCVALDAAQWPGGAAGGALLDPWAEAQAFQSGGAASSGAPSRGRDGRPHGGFGGGAAAGDGRSSSCGAALCVRLLEAYAQHPQRTSQQVLPSERREKGPPVEVLQKERPRPSTAQCKAVLWAADVLPGLELTEVGLDGMLAGDLVRLELRLEGLQAIPNLSFAPQLRSLILTGNKLESLAPLRHCPHLEELQLCQNSLTTLDGIEAVPRLAVLRATMNQIAQADALSKLQALRHVELNKNKISNLRLRAGGLSKLELYRNGLSSVAFLAELPSLTELELGRNRLTSIDERISQWSPLLMKLFLCEDQLVSLPDLRLPLLTDLYLNDNQLETLGPFSFLPSLERLQAKHNKIRNLSSPIAASPLLQELELAFNHLSQKEASRAVPHHLRLQKLQLNDNPVAEELMEKYRPWVLSVAPQLEELDNEPVTEDERRIALVASAAADPCLPYQLAAKAAASARAAASSQVLLQPSAALDQGLMPRQQGSRRSGAASCRAAGLLGLVEHPAEVGGALAARPQSQRPPGRGAGLDSDGVISARRTSSYAAWISMPQMSGAGGCDMCALAACCESWSAARAASLVEHARAERLAARGCTGSMGSRAREEALFALRRREEFWGAFIEMCEEQHLAMMSSGGVFSGAVVARPALEIYSAQRPKQLAARRIQAHWRGALGRRKCAKIRLEEKCSALPQEAVRAFARVQALWRGRRTRRSLQAAGVPVPGHRRRQERERAATRIQALWRGHRVRRARRKARLADDDFDCPEVDVDALLGEVAALDLDDPFGGLELPTAVPAASRRAPPPLPESPAPRGGGISAAAPAVEPHRGGGGPVTAWGTPPATSSGAEARPLGGAAFGGHSPAGTPCSSRSGSALGITRCDRQSMSSTAESAKPEPPDGGRGHGRIDQVKEEWGLEDSATAKAYLAAQRHRLGRKHPGHPSSLPKQVTLTSGRGSGRGGGAAAAPQRSRAAPSGGAVSRSQEPPAKAALQLQEFTSGEPNMKLMRSSKGFLGSSSPRVRSPSLTRLSSQ